MPKNNLIFVLVAVVYVGFCGASAAQDGWGKTLDKLWPLVTLVAPSPLGGDRR